MANSPAASHGRHPPSVSRRLVGQVGGTHRTQHVEKSFPGHWPNLAVRSDSSHQLTGQFGTQHRSGLEIVHRVDAGSTHGSGNANSQYAATHGTQGGDPF